MTRVQEQPYDVSSVHIWQCFRDYRLEVYQNFGIFDRHIIAQNLVSDPDWLFFLHIQLYLQLECKFIRHSQGLRYLSFPLIFMRCNFFNFFKMRPSPFAGKFKRREQKSEQRQQKQAEDPSEDDKGVAKVPSFGVGIKKAKDPKKIYEALNEQEQDKQEEKGVTSLRPNLKLKAGKKIKLAGRQQSKQKIQEEEPPEQIKKPFLKPKLFQKGREDHDQLRQEEIIIDPDERQNTNQEESYDQSQSQSISIAPKFKIKSRSNDLPSQPVIREIPEEHNGPGISNFADLKIQTRQLNLNTEDVKISEVRIEKQNARTRELRNLLNLEIDLFEETLSIACVTPYEIYINKIKSGSLKNSNDQAFDEKNVISCQTMSLQFEDFTNQCPQDYQTDITSIVQNDETQAFNRFVDKVAPVFQELIKPSSSIVMPPVFLLAFRPEFQKLIICPYPLFVYYSESLKTGIIVIGQKLYMTEAEIVSVLTIGNYLIAGCQDGTIHIWTGKNTRGSRLYKKVYDLAQSTNFQLPEFDTNELDRFSVYRTDAAIVSLHSESSDQFFSLDSSCKMVKWKIENVYGRKTQLKPLTSVQFFTLVQRPSMMATMLHRRNQMFFIGTSSGILVWTGQQISQKLDTDGFSVIQFALPHRSNFVYAICEDNSVRIFDQNYSNHLIKMTLPDHDPLVNIYVPDTEYENKKLSLTNKIFVTTKKGKIHSFNLLENRSEGVPLISGQEDEDRNIIFRGVNMLGETFESVRLWRDLKCSSKKYPTGVNLEATVANIKSILEQNRKVHSLMEAETGLSLA